MQTSPCPSSSAKKRKLDEIMEEDEQPAHFKRRATPLPKRRAGRTPQKPEAPPKYVFNVLLPNGTDVPLTVEDPDPDMSVADFLRIVKLKVAKEEELGRFTSDSGKPPRKIRWGPHVYLDDFHGTRLEDGQIFQQEDATLLLYDGGRETIHSCQTFLTVVNCYQNLWDVTPDPSLLGGMPQDYSLETALADLIDNSLQAVWANGPGERRLISIHIGDREISIFDSGQGMDGSKKNCIANWGTMGSSMHKYSRKLGIGGKPPYLKPYFGMYGCGGVLASLHLGGLVTVSSKTKSAKKVMTLKLEKDALMQKTETNRMWKTHGAISDISEEEQKLSPHGSFTKVHIAKLKYNYWKEDQLKCMLKDIYFPYIQNDGSGGSCHTTTPVEFEVNGTNLTEVEGGEVARTNLAACNGPNFEIEIQFTKKDTDADNTKTGPSSMDRANAKLSCFYFPIIQGKESMEKALETTEENFETTWRVSIRRLGRLLPDARWTRLPFMEAPRSRRGEKPKTPVQCFKRVKCFVDTDAGFVPTTSKTDLCHKDLFTIALKKLGRKYEASEIAITIEIERNQRSITPAQLEETYYEWIQKMHESYDEEVECTDDTPTHLIDPLNWKDFGFSTSGRDTYNNVIRVHKMTKRKNDVWASSQRMKILKGACGLKKNLFATLEYILCEGLEGDPGEARMICRPIDVSEEHGSKVQFDNGNPSFMLGSSLTYPLDLISCGKCEKIDESTWNKQLESIQLKSPSFIDVLDTEEASKFDICRGLHSGEILKAGSPLPDEILAVVRPHAFKVDTESGCRSGSNQKYIFKENLEMLLEFRYVGECECVEHCSHGEDVFSMRTKGDTRNQIVGVYSFLLSGENKKPTKAGKYRLHLSLVNSNYQNVIPGKVEIFVQPCDIVGKWKISPSLLSDDIFDDGQSTVRLGSDIGPLHISCFDMYSNQMEFKDDPILKIHFHKKDVVLNIKVAKLEGGLTKDRKNMTLKISVGEGDIDMLRPTFEASLRFINKELCLVEMPIKILPGKVKKLIILDGEEVDKLLKHIRPGDVIHSFCLQALDAYGNAVEKGQELNIELSGLLFQDQDVHRREVDEHGRVNLGGLLKVNGIYGSNGFIRVSSEAEVVLYKEFQVMSRELKIISQIAEPVYSASVLENVEFGVFDEAGMIDEEIDGYHHTLVLNLGDPIQYTFRKGKCKVAKIPLPDKPAILELNAWHALHRELVSIIKIDVLPRPAMEKSLVCVPEELQEVAGYPCSIDDSALITTPVKTDTQNHRVKEEITHSLVQDFMNKIEVWEKDLKQLAIQVKDHESKEENLKLQLVNVDNWLDKNQRELDACLGSKVKGSHSFDETLKQIRRTETAGSVWVNYIMKSKASRSDKYKDSAAEMRRYISGVVSLYGVVNSESLSKVENEELNKALSEYLGMENLLAMVCENKACLQTLEQYDDSGNILENTGIHRLAREQNIKINGRFRVFCLDDLGCYNGRYEKDSQKRLVIEDPKLLDGRIPPGFIGYAVNMLHFDGANPYVSEIEPEVLRGSLFFHLFSYLQVYKTREDLRRAADCVKDAAISLDGGIIRQKGAVECGQRNSFLLRFPTTSCEDVHQSYKIAQIDSQIKEKKEQRSRITAELEKVSRKTQKIKSKFEAKKSELDSMEANKMAIFQNYQNFKEICYEP